MPKYIYRELREKARRIVAEFPRPSFYRVHAPERQRSLGFLGADSMVRVVHAFVVRQLENDFGHGLDHAEKVAVDAGALILVEFPKNGYGPPMNIEECLRNAQIAGLLHDIKRKERHHASAGARYARSVLAAFGFVPETIEDVSQAIRNHEAFQNPSEINTVEGRFVSDCLYDADKFRWGPDNFQNTLWDMLIHLDPSLDEFLKRYPAGMDMIAKIKTTFRTETGKRFGPEFIDIGLAIGEKLYRFLLSEYPLVTSQSTDETIWNAKKTKI